MRPGMNANGFAGRADQEGFSILEVIIAMTVVIFAIAATMTGAGYASRVQAEAESNALAAELAHYVLNRLNALPYNDPLLTDVNPDGVIGRWDTNASGTADHGQLAEYTRLFEPWDAANNRGIFLQVDPNGVPEVWYEGYTFHVAWNIDDNMPFPNQKSIEVIVQSPSYQESIISSSAPYRRQVRLYGTRIRSDG